MRLLKTPFQWHLRKYKTQDGFSFVILCSFLDMDFRETLVNSRVDSGGHVASDRDWKTQPQKFWCTELLCLERGENPWGDGHNDQL
jgi:hypothetical protein